MSTMFDRAKTDLKGAPRRFAVTGAAGFIGSNLVEALLRLDQTVTGLDDFSHGKRSNLDEVKSLVSPAQWARFVFMEGDVRNPAACARACAGAKVVLHQAALGSVPRSLEEPHLYHEVNVTGTLNMLEAARAAGVSRFVYASSSSVYGDDPRLPKREDEIGRCLSPYAATKRMDELYGDVFGRAYGLPTVGLRYFNVFGPRQDPEGAYAAVIPKWIASMLRGEPIHINGTGETSRDFCYVANVVQANLLAALCTDEAALNEVYNVALHSRTTLDELFVLLRDRLAREEPRIARMEAEKRPFRVGDVLHSEADIGKAKKLLGYAPTHTLAQGLDEALPWYKKNAEAAPRVTA